MAKHTEPKAHYMRAFCAKEIKRKGKGLSRSHRRMHKEVRRTWYKGSRIQRSGAWNGVVQWHLFRNQSEPEWRSSRRTLGRDPWLLNFWGITFVLHFTSCARSRGTPRVRRYASARSGPSGEIHERVGINLHLARGTMWRLLMDVVRYGYVIVSKVAILQYDVKMARCLHRKGNGRSERVV
jgi:hypothetical protein